MNVEVVEVRAKERRVLQNLAQFYSYDFSEILGADVAASGRFSLISVGELTDPMRRAFFFKVDGYLAGFALVHKGSELRDDPDVTDMEEFFVMRKYRRRRVGYEAATQLFGMFPGRWEVRELAANTAAQAFWRSVIGEYTGDRYEERLVEGARWHGPVQSFDTNASRRAGG